MSERWSPFSPGLSLWLNGFAKFLRAENDCLVKVRLAPDWMLEMVGLGRSVYSDSDCPDFRLIYLKRFGNFAKLQPGQAGPGYSQARQLRQGQAEELSRARKKYLATTHKDFFSALYILAPSVDG